MPKGTQPVFDRFRIQTDIITWLRFSKTVAGFFALSPSPLTFQGASPSVRQDRTAQWGEYSAHLNLLLKITVLTVLSSMEY